jgi:endoglucanase
MGKGMNTFRVTFLMERMSPPSTGLAGPFNSVYLSGLTTIVNYITNKGGFALLDPHNFMSYNGAQISNTTLFAGWWANLAKQFTSPNVIFDLQNEPNGIPATTVFSLMQAAVNSIRAAGQTKQMIFVEGTSWTGAWTWNNGSGNAAAFTGLTDPANNIAIEMHQYLDSDGSGTSPTCVSSTIGSQRIAAATTWLQQNKFKGVLGEFGAGSNADCISAIQGMLCDMQVVGSPWIGALWWAAGPWWGTYYQSIEPPSGAAIPSILPAILQATQ